MKDPARSAHEARAALLAAALAFVAGGLAAIVAQHGAAAATPAAGVLTYDADGFRYAYQVITGDEALFEIATDPNQLHSVLRTHPALARELRHALESKLRVESLDALRTEQGETIRTLKSLGYL